MAYWHWLTVSCEAGWKRHTRLLVYGWLGGLVVCVGAAIAGGGIFYFTDFREHGGRYEGLMTLVSGFCLLVAGWSLFVPARRANRQTGRKREMVGWLIGGMGGIVLAFDDIVQLHEPASRWLARHGVPAPLGLDHDLYIFGAYAAGLVLTLALLWPYRHRLEPAMLPLLMAIACFAMSEVVDQIPWASMDSGTQPLVGTLEEIYKVLGSWSLAISALLTADEGTGGIGSGG